MIVADKKSIEEIIEAIKGLFQNPHPGVQRVRDGLRGGWKKRSRDSGIGSANVLS